MNKTILKQIIKQIIKESQEFKIPVIYPREIEIPLNSKKLWLFQARVIGRDCPLVSTLHFMMVFQPILDFLDV